MKRLLIVSETWYPDSRATISIMERMAAGIAQQGIEVYAMPLKPLPNGAEYPTDHNGIQTLMPGSDLPDNVSLKWRKLLLKCIQKLLYAEKRLILTGRDCPWNRWITRLRNFQRIRWYQPLAEQIWDISQAWEIRNLIQTHHIDSIISVSLPFQIHAAAARAVKLCPKGSISWVPISFDPYAYDESINQKEKRRRIREEHKTFLSAKKILMLSQSEQDYQSDSLLGKMGFFEIPNVRKLEPQTFSAQIPFKDGHIHCVFIGNLYWTVRNPESLFSLFEQFTDVRIRLHVIGSLSYDFPEDYLASWKSRLGDRITFHGRISSEDAVAVMNRADVLINIGNTTSNQCPSKVLEYISTGKPILSISKIERCTSAAYLQRYPLAHLIREEDCVNKEAVKKAEEYILQSEGRHVRFEEVNTLFCDCIKEKAVEHVLSAFM